MQNLHVVVIDMASSSTTLILGDLKTHVWWRPSAAAVAAWLDEAQGLAGL